MSTKKHHRGGQLVIVNISNLCVHVRFFFLIYLSEDAVIHFTGSALYIRPKPWPLLIIVIVVVIEVKVLSSRGRRPRSVVAPCAACRLLLGGDEVYDGCDDSAVFGLAVLPVHGSGVTNFLLQQRIQLFL